MTINQLIEIATAKREELGGLAQVIIVWDCAPSNIEYYGSFKGNFFLEAPLWGSARNVEFDYSEFEPKDWEERRK